MAKVDLNKDGKIELMEFTVLFEDLIARLELIAAAKKKFEELDVDKSGFLEKPEIDTLMKEVLSHYVEKSPEEREKFQVTLINKIDTNKDGKLDFAEFSSLFLLMTARYELIQRAKEKFVELDVDSSNYLEGAEIDKVVDWALQIHTGEDPGNLNYTYP